MCGYRVGGHSFDKQVSNCLRLLDSRHRIMILKSVIRSDEYYYRVRVFSRIQPCGVGNTRQHSSENHRAFPKFDSGQTEGIMVILDRRSNSSSCISDHTR